MINEENYCITFEGSITTTVIAQEKIILQKSKKNTNVEMVIKSLFNRTLILQHIYSHAHTHIDIYVVGDTSVFSVLY